MLHKKDFGKWGESKVITQVLDNGCAAFIDFGDNSKVDLIVEDSNHVIHKVQVKAATRENETSKLYLYKHGPGYRFKYELGMVDWFALVDGETGDIAWFKSTEKLFEHNSHTLRHTPSKNNQHKKVKWFKDYVEFPFS